MTQNSEKKPRGEGKRFPKGVTGNPGGRPKRTAEELDLIAACKTKAPAALDVILQIMEVGQSDKVRLSAAIAIIERAYGKAIQAVDQKVTGSLTVTWPLPRSILDE